jgi:hypothetical protein
MPFGAIAGLACVLVVTMVSAQAATQADDRKKLEDTQQQLIKAWVTSNRSILERLLAPDWMVTHADGRMSTREDVLRDFDTGANRLLEGQVDDVRVLLFEGFAIEDGVPVTPDSFSGTTTV